MKKIMLSAAVLAALIGTATAATTVTSANVVGYNDDTVKKGYSLKAPAFMGVGTSGLVDLSKFKILNSVGEGGETIQFLDAEGMNTEIWVWLGSAVGMTEGWYDSNTWEPVEKSIKKCEGYLFNVNADVTIESSGEVRQDAVVTDLAAQSYAVVGNSTPVSFDIQQVKMVDSAGDGGDTIQYLDLEGMNTEIWVWLGSAVGMTEGWYDSNTWEPITYTVKPGEAFLFNVSADVKVSFPGAVTK